MSDSCFMSQVLFLDWVLLEAYKRIGVTTGLALSTNGKAQRRTGRPRVG